MTISREEALSRCSFAPARTVKIGIRPKVSVVVPVYDAEPTLEQALASVPRGFGFGGVEIVCVDDGSTDGSRGVLDGIADARVSRAYHSRNLGYGAAMNTGVALASGEWIAVLEPDDYIEGDMYSAMLSAAGAAGADVVKTPYRRAIRREGVEKGGPELVANCSYRGRVPEGAIDMSDDRAAHLLRHHPSIWSAIYSRCFLDAEGISFVEHPGAGWADNEFFYETLLRARRIVYLDEPFYCYREETDGEFAGFVRSHPRLPFERWHAMQDIVDGLGAPDGVRASHISRGFTYLSGVEGVLGAEDPLVAEEKARLFSRMDAGLVERERQLPVGLKREFLDFRGIGYDAGGLAARYAASLASEAGYAMLNNGPLFTARQVAGFLLR